MASIFSAILKTKTRNFCGISALSKKGEMQFSKMSLKICELAEARTLIMLSKR